MPAACAIDRKRAQALRHTFALLLFAVSRVLGCASQTKFELGETGQSEQRDCIVRIRADVAKVQVSQTLSEGSSGELSLTVDRRGAVQSPQDHAQTLQMLVLWQAVVILVAASLLEDLAALISVCVFILQRFPRSQFILFFLCDSGSRWW